MRIEPVNTIEEANEHLRPYLILKGLIYEPLEKQIKDVFVGISDPPISAAIYRSQYAEFPNHPFTRSDLNNIYLYAAFNDKSVIQIGELYNDPKIKKILEAGTLGHSLTLKPDNEWSDPVSIPRGLGAILRFDGSGKLEYEVKDVMPSGITRKGQIEEIETRDRHNIRYLDYLHEMKNPMIRLRAKNGYYTDLEISILFTQI
jgi:hypothetical protein